MKKYLLLSLLVVTASFVFSSCSSDDKDEIYVQSASDCFELVSDISNGGMAGYPGISYQIEYNYTRMLANVSVSNFRLPDGTAFPTMTFAAIPFEVKSNGWIVVSTDRTQPSIPGFSSVPTFYNFSLSILNRDFDGVNYPGFCLRANVDMMYSILSAPTGTLLFGSTRTTSGEGQITETTATGYAVNVNPETRMLTITMVGAQFAPGMPAMNIVLPSIPFTVNGSVISFSAPLVVPVVNNMPFPTFPITELSGTYDFRRGMIVSYHCKPQAATGEYDVAVTTDFTNDKPMVQ